jgi:hypothetical protein
MKREGSAAVLTVAYPDNSPARPPDLRLRIGE